MNIKGYRYRELITLFVSSDGGLKNIHCLLVKRTTYFASQVTNSLIRVFISYTGLGTHLVSTEGLMGKQLLIY